MIHMTYIGKINLKDNFTNFHIPSNINNEPKIRIQGEALSIELEHPLYTIYYFF
jgi:hypothetical protein